MVRCGHFASGQRKAQSLASPARSITVDDADREGQKKVCACSWLGSTDVDLSRRELTPPPPLAGGIAVLSMGWSGSKVLDRVHRIARARGGPCRYARRR